MFEWIVNAVLGPVLNTITAIWTKKEDVVLGEYKVDGKIDVALVQAAVEVAKVNATLLQNKWMIRLQFAFGAPLAFHFGKCVFWDNDLQYWTHGHTDPLTGDIATYSMWIVGFLFLHSAVASWGRK